MSYPKSYKIKFTAKNPSDSTMTTTKWSDIQIKTSSLSLFIDGGDRDITIDKENSFIANAEPKSSNLIYKWGCYEQTTGAFCLSPNSTTYLNFLVQLQIQNPEKQQKLQLLYMQSLVKFLM
jgi:hypothetical protein